MPEKIAVIVVKLIPSSKVYENKTNVEIAEEIKKNMGIVPYAAEVMQVTVIDVK